MSNNRSKSIWAAALATIMVFSLAACNSAPVGSVTQPNPGEEAPAGQAEAPSNDTKAHLIVASADVTQQGIFDEEGLEGKFNELYPNVTVEIERYAESGDFENAMKIRASSNSLPDVMVFKPTALSDFHQSLLSLDDLEAAQGNLYAREYAINGEIKGLPDYSTREYVYYWKDVFEDCGVQVPTTWEEFIAVAESIKEQRPDLTPILMGAKDEWPNYPFNEYMPALVSGNGEYWSYMATQDEPFAPGTDFAKAYGMINELYKAQVFGADPQGIGWDQAKAMFTQKQGAIILGGGWASNNMEEDAGDEAGNIGTFFLPSRTSESESFRTISQADGFFAISADTKNPEIAGEFLNFYFSDAWYPAYIQKFDQLPTMQGVSVDLKPMLMEAVNAQPDAEVVLYNGGDLDFSNLVRETKFDYKKLGVEMMTPGYDLEARLAELNAAWTEARGTLGLGE